MPNLLDLIKNDSGVQELLASAGAMTKGAARGVTTDLAGAPVDLSNLVLGLMAGKGFEGLAKEPVGGSKSIRKAVGQPTEDTGMEAAGNLLTALLPNPGAAGHAIPMAIGAIRQGGKSALNMSHNSRMGDLTRALTKSPFLDSISIGIADRQVYPFAAYANSVSLLPNPVSHLFDPATNKLNQLINRDMYASRARDLRTLQVNRRNQYDYRAMEGTKPGDLFAASGQDGLATAQGYGTIADYSQELAIAASPSFSSFKAYEKSDKGGKLLTEDIVSGHSKEVEKAVIALYKALYPSGSFGKAPADIRLLVSTASQDPDPNRRAAAAQALKAMQTIPSNYAELKMGGRMEVSPDTITAILANPIADEYGQLAKLQKLVGPDIPVGAARDMVPASFTSRYEDLATLMAEATKKARKEGRLESSSPNSVEAFMRDTPGFSQFTDTLVPLNISDFLYDPAALSKVKEAVTSSRPFEADVASFLNAIKLDNAK